MFPELILSLRGQTKLGIYLNTNESFSKFSKVLVYIWHTLHEKKRTRKNVSMTGTYIIAGAVF